MTCSFSYDVRLTVEVKCAACRAPRRERLNPMMDVLSFTVGCSECRSHTTHNLTIDRSPSGTIKQIRNDSRLEYDGRYGS